eukprot:TRINITY_DN2354_c0_g1_i1.p1 TRINITY_DN2354_c0_g1~~TRINITY_DN2354_c0_g1_i1.p1  ORF type:complete len:456 (-),score=88.70 TRINITY_DN2354_c0_g1_i1:308-1675(-)
MKFIFLFAIEESLVFFLLFILFTSLKTKNNFTFFALYFTTVKCTAFCVLNSFIRTRISYRFPFGITSILFLFELICLFINHNFPHLSHVRIGHLLINIGSSLIIWNFNFALFLVFSYFWIWLPTIFATISTCIAIHCSSFLMARFVDIHLFNEFVDQRQPILTKEYPLNVMKPLKQQHLNIIHFSDLDQLYWPRFLRIRNALNELLGNEVDLVVFTGDCFMSFTHQHLQKMLRPLSKLCEAGKVFAIPGNKDSKEDIENFVYFSKMNIRILCDEVAILDTRIGKVQVLGIDFHQNNIQIQVRNFCSRNPPIPNTFRLFLCHNPELLEHLSSSRSNGDTIPQFSGEKKFLAEGDEGCGVDLALAGHCHGGYARLPFKRIGARYMLDWINLITKIPTRGLWARGDNRMYVSRGISCGFFPCRFLIFPQLSLLRITGDRIDNLNDNVFVDEIVEEEKN